MYAFSEMAHRASMLREFCAHISDLSPCVAGLGDCESPFAHLKSEKTIAGKFLVRHFLAKRQALATQELGDVYWIPGLGNPPDGFTKTKSGAAPLLRLLELGAYFPRTICP